jgi:hypothetical protein
VAHQTQQRANQTKKPGSLNTHKAKTKKAGRLVAQKASSKKFTNSEASKATLQHGGYWAV